MTGIVIIAHAPLASALEHCVEHVYTCEPDMAKANLRALDVEPGAAIAVVVAGVLVGGTLAAVALRRRRRAKGAPMADAKLIVKRLIEEPWKGNFDVIDDLVAYAAPTSSGGRTAS